MSGVVGQSLEKRFHSIRMTARLADVPKGQGHALGPGMLTGMRAQGERDVVDSTCGVGRGVASCRPGLGKVLAHGADAIRRSVAVAVAAVVGAVT